MKSAVSNIAVCIVGVTVLSSPVGAQTCPPGIPRVAPDSRYINNGNGTITDQQTGLMWKRCSEGQSGSSCSGTPSLATWQTALQSAAGSAFAGFVDWRLPSVKELHSLVEYGCHSPSINTNRFPNTPGAIYWTSTSDNGDPSYAWAVSFDYGLFESTIPKNFSGGSVRLVRGQ
jgi:hypothetical protein